MCAGFSCQAACMQHRLFLPSCTNWHATQAFPAKLHAAQAFRAKLHAAQAFSSCKPHATQGFPAKLHATHAFCAKLHAAQAFRAKLNATQTFPAKLHATQGQLEVWGLWHFLLWHITKCNYTVGHLDSVGQAGSGMPPNTENQLTRRHWTPFHQFDGGRSEAWWVLTHGGRSRTPPA